MSTLNLKIELFATGQLSCAGLAVMGEMDEPRNETFTRFLRDSGMNGWIFAQADMRNLDLKEAYLTDANFSGSPCYRCELSINHIVKVMVEWLY